MHHYELLSSELVAPDPFVALVVGWHGLDRAVRLLAAAGVRSEHVVAAAERVLLRNHRLWLRHNAASHSTAHSATNAATNAAAHSPANAATDETANEACAFGAS